MNVSDGVEQNTDTSLYEKELGRTINIICRPILIVLGKYFRLLFVNKLLAEKKPKKIASFYDLSQRLRFNNMERLPLSNWRGAPKVVGCGIDWFKNVFPSGDVSAVKTCLSICFDGEQFENRHTYVTCV